MWLRARKSLLRPDHDSARRVLPEHESLDPLRVAADVVVVTREHAEAWGDVPGTLVHDALGLRRLTP